MKTRAISILLLTMFVLVLPQVAYASTPPVREQQETVIRCISEASELGDPVTLPDIVGYTFKVAVVIEDVTDLYGFDVQFNWTTNWIHYVGYTVTVPIEDFPAPNPPSPYEGTLYSPILSLRNVVNETGIPDAKPGSMAWFAYASMAPASPQTGDTTICVFSFEVVDQPYYYGGTVTPVEVKLHFTSTDLAGFGGTIIPHTVEDLIVNLWPRPALHVSVYTEKYTYHAGETMKLGLHIINEGSATRACIVVWIVTPDSKVKVILHAHNQLLPAGLDYDNPSFKTFTLPSIKSGIYTWHAALTTPSTHQKIVEDTAEWQFS